MNINSHVTHAIVYISGQGPETQFAPGHIAVMLSGDEQRVRAKFDGYCKLKGGEYTLVALDDEMADERWKGKCRTPREFFVSQYDDGGVPRDWIVKNALR